MSVPKNLPVSLPFAPISTDLDAASIALSFLPRLSSLQPTHFVPSAIWRDLYALTGTLRTFYSPTGILSAWSHLTANPHSKPTNFHLVDGSAMVFRAGPVSWIQAIFTFEIGIRECQAIVSLVREDGEWGILLLRTILDGFKGVRSVDFLDFIEPEKPIQSQNGKVEGEEEKKSHFDCVIVGAGQVGLDVAGRLKALGGVNYVVLEKNAEVGDNWKKRYDRCKLHLPRETAHLPFERTFGPEYPEYLTKDNLAQGYKNWAKRYNINVWTSTSLSNGSWDPPADSWTLKILQGNSERTLTCSHVVMAIGGGGQIPKMPTYPNFSIYKDTTLHSVSFKNASSWKDKHGIVIGTASTGHDIAEDMLASGLHSITMVQRSPTYVVPAEHIGDVIKQSYNAHIPTVVADQATWSMPYPVLAQLYNGNVNHRASMEPERFNDLERARLAKFVSDARISFTLLVGFKLERNGQLAVHIFERLGGHYLDVGASQKIVDGKIKMKSDSLPVKWVEDGLLFEDGETLQADVVVFATGFDNNLKNQVSELFGKETAEKMGDWWGFDKEGEIRGAFRPGGQKGMWYVGGDQSQCRYYSRFVGLSIKADVMGLLLEIFEEAV